MEEYFHVVKNYPKELAEKGKEEATRAVMQEKKRGGAVSLIEDYRSVASDDPNVVKNIASNLAKTYVASKFSFIRTMTNIYKQSLTERGVGKLGKILFANPEDAKRFADDDVFKQEAMAQVGSGLLFTGIGIGLVTHMLDNEGKEIYMEVLDSTDRGNRTSKLTQGGEYGPVIKIRDLETNIVTSYSLERMDMAKAPVVLAAIGAQYLQQGTEALEKLGGPRSLEAGTELEDLHIKLAKALGDFTTDLPMAQGVSEFLKNMIPGFGPMWNPSKEMTTFFHGFFNPYNSVFSSLAGSAGNARERERFSKPSSQKNQMRDMSKGALGLEGTPWKDQKYTGKFGQDEYVDVPFKGEKIGTILKILKQMQTISERVSIVDMRQAGNPILGQDSYALVSPEGNYIRHLPDPTKTKFESALATLALPLVENVQAKENTITLLNYFEKEYEDVVDWDTKTNYNFSPEQLYTWSVYAGRYNKKTFNSKHYNDIVFEIENGLIDLNSANGREYKNDLAEYLQQELTLNREDALEDMLYLQRNEEARMYYQEATRKGRPPALDPRNNL
tara:strand:+ start:6 stop:1679 length:1674 start_codon:yes stop_codon:yes gene_type:complete